MTTNNHDKLFQICSKLIRIDNRPATELADETHLCLSTIYRLRSGRGRYMRSTTVMQIAQAMRKTIEVK